MTQNRFQGILFDLDGTLLDTTPLIMKSFQYTFQTVYNRDVGIEEVQPFMGRPLRDAMEVMAPGKVDEVLAVYRAYQQIHHDKLAGIFSGVAETLETLFGWGITLAVVTSKGSELAARGLRLFGLDNYFAAIIGFEESPRHKPEPDPALVAINRLHLNTTQCIMVGDSPFDIECGNRAGVKTAAVKWTNVPWDDVIAAKPDYILTEMSDLLQICRGEK